MCRMQESQHFDNHTLNIVVHTAKCEICGKDFLAVSKCCSALVCRHGRQHSIMPSLINYRACIWTLKEEGCTHVLTTTACGSLQEHIHPGDVVIIDQFIDRTHRREQTFYDGHSGVGPLGICHMQMDLPFCERTRKILIQACQQEGIPCHKRGVIVTIEGPRFSTKAESVLFRSWGADLVNMTTVPEVCLAKEAGLCYASIALPTDYDCWREAGEPVSRIHPTCHFNRC